MQEVELLTDRSPYFFRRDELKNFRRLSARPGQHYIETHAAMHAPHILQSIRHESPHASMSLTTATAFRQPAAEFFTGRIARTRALSPQLAGDIQLCLQEAIANAVIHGNLAITPEQRDGIHFQHYMEQLSRRMDSDPQGRKCISIFAWFTRDHVTLSVSDEGKGFRLDQAGTSHGLGLEVMRTIASSLWQTTPNNIYLQFRYY